MCKLTLLVAVLALVLSGAVSAEECHYELAGDWNQDCKVDFVDFALMAASWLVDCGVEPNNPACVPLDIDGDGYDVSIDCNDNDPNISPAASEVCGNGIDDDCDGLIDGDDDPNCAAYSHTILIDGVKDFTADEAFATSSGAGYTGYISWNSQYLYIGMEGADVGGGSTTKWVLVYIGGSFVTTTTGLTYNTQQPSLAFGARYHIQWKADNAWVSEKEYNGASWDDAGWPGSAHKAGQYLEMRVPLTSIGSPSTVRLHLNMISQTDGMEWSYAAVPSTSFVDGYDPDYTHYYEFDLSSPAVPNSYTPLP